MKFLEIQYCFQMEDGQREIFSVQLDPARLESRMEETGDLPDWTHLAFHQCENCTLSVDETRHCPAAVNLVGIVNRFDHLLSYDETQVVVKSQERTVYRETTMQKGVSSLIGLLMATSGCPMTAFFKPMARFHLPFASTDETIWRATSAYLLSQYYRQQEGHEPDVEFHGLSQIYNNIQIVNLAFARRLRSASQHDSMVNAIILLDMFAKSMPMAIEASLEEIRHLFVPYLCRTDAQSCGNET